MDASCNVNSSPLDAVLQPLKVGDTVAYVTRRGSKIEIDKRTVATLDPHENQPWTARLRNWEGKVGQPTKTYNLVKIN